MNVGVFPADDGGCGSYRLRWPGEALRAQGYDVSVIDPGFKFGSPAKPVELPYDVIVIQRPMVPAYPALIAAWRKRGHVVVVDLDDDLLSLDHRHPAKFVDPAPLIACCKLADLLTVSTPALADVYGAHGRVAVLPNCVPEEYLSVVRARDTGATGNAGTSVHDTGRTGNASTPLVVGWTGEVRSHPGDLDVVGSGLVTAKRKHDFVFKVLGREDGIFKATALHPTMLDWCAIDEYPLHVAAFDVGLAPLRITRFNTAKSWLKPLEYSALGVPWIASPTYEYAALHDLGVGMLANNARQWHGCLSRLLGDGVMRRELAEAGREVAATLTIERHADNWAHAWTATKGKRHAA